MLIHPNQDSNLNKNGISEETIISMIGNGFDRVETQSSIITGSRNLLYRIRLGSGGGHSMNAVIKWYLPELDRFFEHRFRREEKLLALLDRWFTQRVPRVYGGIIVPNRYGLLVMEDLGKDQLEKLFQEGDSSQRQQLLSQAVDLLSELHAVTSRYYTQFHRIIYSVELDRLTSRTYARKLRIALNRMLNLYRFLNGQSHELGNGGDTQAPRLEELGLQLEWHSVRDSFEATTIRALISSPKNIIHNSYAPSHLLLHEGKLKVLDFETMTVGAAQVDLAEFLRFPSLGLNAAEVHSGLRQYYDNLPAKYTHQGFEQFEHVFWCANISRSLDYAGTLARRCVKYQLSGEPQEAQAALTRSRAYLEELLLSYQQLPAGYQAAPVRELAETLLERLAPAVEKLLL